MGILHLLLSFVFLVVFSWHWILRNMKSPVYDWPLFGMLPSLLWNTSNLNDFFAQALTQSGGTFLLKGPSFINADYLVTSDAMNCHHIFTRNPANYDKGQDLKVIMEPLGDTIFNVDGDSWKYQRHLLHSLLNNTAFESHMMRTLRVKMEDTLFRVLDDASRLGTCVVDMQDVSKRFMFDNICLLGLGFDDGISVDGISSTVFANAFDEMSEAAVHRHIVPIPIWKLQSRFDIGMEKKVRRSWMIMDRYLYGNIKRVKEALSSSSSSSANNINNKAQNLLTQILIREEETSDKFLRDMWITLLVAGRDTIAAGLTWLLWLVARHPEVEKKILEEIKEVIAARDDGVVSGMQGFMSKYELNKLVYLHAVVCETFRLYPPVPIEHKCAVERDVLPSGHVVSRGTRILFSIYSMGRMEETWGKDCMEFKPERWISEKGGIIHVPSYKFMAFLAGARACLGKNMAFMEVKALASALLYNYKFHLVEDDDDHHRRQITSMVITMKDGLKTRVSKRD
ncbi:Alkane hydroxylase MAH1 [Linum grandiflorum]